jgi:hypothetical protein
MWEMMRKKDSVGPEQSEKPKQPRADNFPMTGVAQSFSRPEGAPAAMRDHHSS